MEVEGRPDEAWIVRANCRKASTEEINRMATNTLIPSSALPPLSLDDFPLIPVALALFGGDPFQVLDLTSEHLRDPIAESAMLVRAAGIVQSSPNAYDIGSGLNQLKDERLVQGSIKPAVPNV